MTSSRPAHSPERAQDADTVHPSSNIFPFLKLPGELRNKIYGFLLASTPHSVSRGYMPLIQFTNTCAQIRSEFRPLLLSQHIVNVDDACRYIETFLITTKIDVDRHDKFLPVTDVHLGVGQGRYDGFETTDLIPLLRLLVNHPLEIKVTFTDDLDTPVNSLERLLRYRSKHWISLLTRNDLIGILELKVRTWGHGFPVFVLAGLRNQGNGQATFSTVDKVNCSWFVGPSGRLVEKIRIFEGQRGCLMMNLSRGCDTKDSRRRVRARKPEGSG